MRWIGWSLLLALNCGEAMAQACVVHSQAERLDVKVCQQNRNIPQKLFADGFCQQALPGRKSRCSTSTNALPGRSACAATPKSPICPTGRIFTITALPRMRRI